DEEIEEFNPDILFINGLINKPIEWIKRQKEKGIKIVVDCDDYWEISPTHPVHDIWYQTKSNDTLKEYLRTADIVFAINEQLRKKVLEFNKNCVVIPNAVPFGTPYFQHEGVKFIGQKMNF